MKNESCLKKKLRSRLYGFAAAVQEGALEFPESYEFWLDRIYDLFPHWISVEDKLPNEDEFVQVFCGGHAVIGRLHKKRWQLGFETKTCVHIISANSKDKVTHWMPLPAPPNHIIDINKMVKKGGEG